MFLALFVVMSCYTYSYLQNSKQLLTESCSNTVSFFKQRINTHISRINDNAEDLALTGLLFYTGRNYEMAKKVISETFDNNYEGALGGGIWFEPYVINPSKRLFNIYVYRNNKDDIFIENGSFDYLERVWYKQLSNKLKKGKNKIVWSTPYFDIQENKLIITASYGIYDNSGKMLGLTSVDCELSEIYKYLLTMKPTPNSFAVLIDKENNCIVVSTEQGVNYEEITGKSISTLSWFLPSPDAVTTFMYNGINYLSFERELDNGMVLIINVPSRELFNQEIGKVVILFIALISISIVISILLYLLLKSNIKTPIDKLICIADRIGKGEADIDIKIEKPLEFATLAQTFDHMAKNLKSITSEKERINSELLIANSIQHSSLPNLKEDFSGQKNFSVSASMLPAKEVGGDFYDGYFIDDDRFMFLIADVAGKGIPAALFMMTVKTLVNNLSQVGYSYKELIKTINHKICSNNKQGFFVTMLIGIVDFKNNRITYINCGHNKPLVRTRDGLFGYLDLDSNIVLGAFDDFDFKLHEMPLDYGDTIFFYTDGITEALNEQNELYGDERLLKIVNKNKNDTLDILVENIKNDVKEFIGQNSQSDDITMLMYKHLNKNNIRIYKDKAVKDNYKDVYQWLHRNCEDWTIDNNLTNKIDMCVEEVYANIIFYAYPNDVDYVKITMEKIDNGLSLKFEDRGVPYNPLEKKDPDITLPLEERPLGGLGIFMVKELADEVSYKYENEQNIFELNFLFSK